MLSSQDDFKCTRSRLQEIVEDTGHIFIPYTKFHCELNWIEYYWGRCKYFTRKHCNYSLSGKRLECSTCTWVAACSLYQASGLREVIPQALEPVKGSLICKFWERTQRILKAYREGAVLGEAACKQQVDRIHRRVQIGFTGVYIIEVEIYGPRSRGTSMDLLPAMHCKATSYVRLNSIHIFRYNQVIEYCQHHRLIYV